MLALFVSDDQPHPRAEPTDDERIKLHKAMLAYGGTYKLSPGKVIHHIDIEWDGRRLGTEQVRFYIVEGDELVIKTEQNKVRLTVARAWEFSHSSASSRSLTNRDERHSV